MSVLMRRARVTDLDRIMRLERATFTDDAWPEAAMRRELESEHGYYLVAIDDAPAVDDTTGRSADDTAGETAVDGAEGAEGDPAGPDDETSLDPSLLGYAGLLAPKGGGQGDVQTIAVAPAARGMGLGRGLMHALITESRRRGVAELFLEVRADNPIARSLYRSLGFEEIGVRPRYYRHGIDAVLMRLAVPAAVARPALRDGAR
jgi:[ribosomal protein S18]-alanine N-acetyltransferase